MTFDARRIGLALALVSMGALVGCGGDDDDKDSSGAPTTGGGGSGGGVGGGGGGGGGASFTCCLNDVYYRCPDMRSMEACASFFDSDPSGCERQSGACPNSGSGGGGSGSGGGGGGGSGGGGGNGGGSGGGGGGSAQPVGGECKGDGDCQSRICVANAGASYGYCSKVCESFADCPTFWDCEKLGNASQTYCVKN